MSISTRLYTLRVDHGYSQDELAQIIGVSRQAISKWERAESVPDTDKLVALSELYGITIDEILKGENQEVIISGLLSGESGRGNSETGQSSLESIHLSEAADELARSATFSHEASENVDAPPRNSSPNSYAPVDFPTAEAVIEPSPKRRATLIVCFAVVLLAVALIIGQAWTQENEKTEAVRSFSDLNVAENMRAVSQQDPRVLADSDESAYLEIGNDKFYTAKDVTLNGNVEGNLFAAGQFVGGSALSVTSDAFLAGQTVVIAGWDVGNAIYAAGESIFIGAGEQETQAKAVACSGRNLSVSGAFESAYLAGEYVIIDGTFSGDMFVDAETLKVCDSAVIQGTLHVDEDTALDMSDKAQVAKVHKFNSLQLDSRSYDNVLFGIVFGLLSSLAVAALLLLVLGDKPIKEALATVRKYPVRVPATGAIAVVVLPVAALLLLVTTLGLPMAVAGILLFITTMLLCMPFTAVCFGRALLPHWNHWGSGLLCAGAFSLVVNAPILGTLLWVASIVFTLGYLVVAYWTWRNNKES